LRFSEAFKIHRGKADDWFDPHLTVDTELFVDPIQIVGAKGLWKGAHDELVEHFGHCYRLVGIATGPNSISAKRARSLLSFSEPWEFGLGYTAVGTRGSGSGSGFARKLADGIAVAIAAGLVNPEHIEEIGILNEGFGADRISDATCNVLKARFIKYTQAIAKRHGVPVKGHKVKNARCDPENGRWFAEVVQLPTNPETDNPMILVPKRFLNDLPVLNADDWFDANLNDDLRNEFNWRVGQHVSKSVLVDIARRHPDRVRAWARSQASRPDLKGYDFGDDRPVEFAQTHPIALLAVPQNPEDLSVLVERVLDQYSHFIEQQGGWAMLFNSDKTEKPESAAQLMFMAMAQHYLRLFDVEVDREVDLGRGPVDFKIASGSSKRLLIEIKKAHNGKFWNGLDSQLPSYLVSDQSKEGWFLAIRYRNNRASELRMKELPEKVKKCAKATSKTIKYKAVDARPPVSASKIKP
jgi:hypothetical protein